LGRIYGRQIIGFFSRYYQTALYVLIATAVAAGIGALVFFLRRRHNMEKQDIPSNGGSD
jgi:hypothetical protein